MSEQTAARKIASLIDVGSLQYPTEDKIVEIIEVELTALREEKNHYKQVVNGIAQRECELMELPDMEPCKVTAEELALFCDPCYCRNALSDQELNDDS